MIYIWLRKAVLTCWNHKWPNAPWPHNLAGLFLRCLLTHSLYHFLCLGTFNTISGMRLQPVCWWFPACWQLMMPQWNMSYPGHQVGGPGLSQTPIRSVTSVHIEERIRGLQKISAGLLEARFQSTCLTSRPPSGQLGSVHDGVRVVVGLNYLSGHLLWC